VTATRHYLVEERPAASRHGTKLGTHVVANPTAYEASLGVYVRVSPLWRRLEDRLWPNHSREGKTTSGSAIQIGPSYGTMSPSNRLGWRGQTGRPTSDLITEDNMLQTPSHLDPGLRRDPLTLRNGFRDAGYLQRPKWGRRCSLRPRKTPAEAGFCEVGRPNELRGSSPLVLTALTASGAESEKSVKLRLPLWLPRSSPGRL